MKVIRDIEILRQRDISSFRLSIYYDDLSNEIAIRDDLKAKFIDDVIAIKDRLDAKEESYTFIIKERSFTIDYELAFNLYKTILEEDFMINKIYVTVGDTDKDVLIYTTDEFISITNNKRDISVNFPLLLASQYIPFIIDSIANHRYFRQVVKLEEDKRSLLLIEYCTDTDTIDFYYNSDKLLCYFDIYHFIRLSSDIFGFINKVFSEVGKTFSVRDYKFIR